MAQDHFAVLGLSPGRYNPREITARFLARRQVLLEELADPQRHHASRRELDQLHLAYRALRDPLAQDRYLRQDTVEPADQLRVLIAAALEEGLLRHSRRQAILDHARELGLSEFQAHLLIAEVQFGPAGPRLALPAAAAGDTAGGVTRVNRPWARLVAVGLLAMALFFFGVRLLEG